MASVHRGAAPTCADVCVCVLRAAPAAAESKRQRTTLAQLPSWFSSLAAACVRSTVARPGRALARLVRCSSKRAGRGAGTRIEHLPRVWRTRRTSRAPRNLEGGASISSHFGRRAPFNLRPSVLCLWPRGTSQFGNSKTPRLKECARVSHQAKGQLDWLRTCHLRPLIKSIAYTDAQLRGLRPHPIARGLGGLVTNEAPTSGQFCQAWMRPLRKPLQTGQALAYRQAALGPVRASAEMCNNKRTWRGKSGSTF